MNIGSLVRLKSGGPVMTINAINSMNHVVCFWFVKGALFNGVFDERALERVTNHIRRGAK